MYICRLKIEIILYLNTNSKVIENEQCKVRLYLWGKDCRR